MSNEQIMQIGVGLLLAAYAYIFRSMDKRIENLEMIDCDPESCGKRFDKIEEKQDKSDPIFLEIKERLVRIEVILEELKKEK